MRLFRLSGLISGLGVVLSGCLSGDLDVGQSVIKPNELEIQSIDSTSIHTANVMVPDTFVTSADTNLLVGHWTDPQKGNLVGRSFCSVDYTTHELRGDNNVRFDSLVLEMGYGFTYGDTTQLFDLRVHKLDKTPEEDVYYNNNAAAYAPVPLMSKRFLLRPVSKREPIRLPIPQRMALEFWNGLLDGTIYSQETVREFWHGFAFTTGTSANIFAGLSAANASGLRLYYHRNNLERTEQSIRFSIQSVHFSQFMADRSGSALSSLTRRSDQLTSRRTNQSSFVGVGYRTRIEFPYLRPDDRPERYAGLNHATLSIQPVRRSANDNTPPPAQLALYLTNNQNDLLDVVPAGPIGTDLALANYASDPNELELTDAYSFNLTYYISGILRGKIPNRPLLLSVPAGQTNLQTVVRSVTVGNGSRSTDRMRLTYFITRQQ